MRIAAAMAVWGFCMAVGLTERCGHTWTRALEAGAAEAVTLFVAVLGLVAVARRLDG